METQQKVSLRMSIGQRVGITVVCIFALSSAALLLVPMFQKETTEPPVLSKSLSLVAIQEKSIQKADAMVALQNGTGEDTPARDDAIARFAKERLESLRTLAEKDPALLKTALSPEQLLEKESLKYSGFLPKQTLEGSITTLIKENEEQAKTVYTLTTADGTARTLIAENADEFFGDIPATSTIQMEGYTLENPSDPFFVVLNRSAINTANIAESAAVTAIVGQQRIATFFVNFTDDTRTPYTQAEINEKLYTSPTSLDGLYREMSFQNISITGTTDPVWHTLPLTNCYFNQVRDRTVAAVNAAVDFRQFDTILIIMPKQNRGDCNGFNGAAWIGKFYGVDGTIVSVAILNGSTTPLTMGHELGHAFGVHHAASWYCPTTIIYGSCSLWEYGNFMSIMGAARAGHWDAQQKYKVGWFNPQESASVTATGDYTLVPSNDPARSGVRVLRIPRAFDVLGVPRAWYYAEYREPVGFDAPNNFVAENANGLLVSYEDSSIPTRTRLLDMTPASGSAFDAALPMGRRYIDEVSGISFTPIEKTAAGMRVHVDIPQPPPCTYAAPTLTLTTPVIAGYPNAFNTGSYAIRSNATAPCLSETFNLSIQITDPNLEVYVSTPVTVPPGGTGTGNVVVFPLSNAIPGDYTFTVTAVNSGNTALTSTVSGTFTVLPPYDDVPPIVTLLHPEDRSTISGIVNVEATAVDNVGVSEVQLEVRNFAADLVRTFSLANIGNNTYSVIVDISDLPDGFYAFQVHGMDVSGNFGWDYNIVSLGPNGSFLIYAPFDGTTISGVTAISMLIVDPGQHNARTLNLTDPTGTTTVLATLAVGQTEFAWDTHGYINGTYELNARACTESGDCISSNSTHMVLENTQELFITEPQNGTTVWATIPVRVVWQGLSSAPANVHYTLSEGIDRRVVLAQQDIIEPPFTWNLDTTPFLGPVQLNATICTQNNECVSTTTPTRVSIDQASAPPIPVISVSEPVAGSKVSGGIMYGATLDDPGTVTDWVRFRFMQGDIERFRGNFSTPFPPFPNPIRSFLNTLIVPDGPYQLVADAEDGGTTYHSDPMNIIIANQPCAYGVPLVTPISDLNRIAAPGNTVVFTLRVTNTSRYACNASGYLPQFEGPNGWQAVYLPNPLTLEPGETQDVGIGVSVPQTALRGKYPFIIHVTSAEQLGINLIGTIEVQQPTRTPLPPKYTLP